MSRIEDALAKLRTQTPVPAAHTNFRRHKATESEDVRSHDDAPAGVYGGKPADIDLDKLRAHGLLASGNNERRLADEYRAIKRPLLRNAISSSVSRGNLLMVASALAGEGKTFTSINLCLSVAREQDWEVVLVDGDCNKPHLSTLFEAANEPGLMDLLRDATAPFESFVMPTRISGLSLLPAGRRDEHASELLASARMETLCTHLASANTRRVIIFDSPPVLLTSEAQALAMHVGQVVLVVRADKTPQRLVLAARDLLDSSKAITLLLNQSANRGASTSYGEYYSHSE